MVWMARNAVNLLSVSWNIENGSCLLSIVLTGVCYIKSLQYLNTSHNYLNYFLNHFKIQRYDKYLKYCKIWCNNALIYVYVWLLFAVSIDFYQTEAVSPLVLYTIVE